MDRLIMVQPFNIMFEGEQTMFEDTVLLGGIGFLLAGGVIWYLHERMEKSSWPTSRKRLGTYALMAILAGLAIYIIDWHASSYKAEKALLLLTDTKILA